MIRKSELLKALRLPKRLRMWFYVREVNRRVEKDEYKSFTSWQVIDNSGYVDFLFVGEYKGRPVVWNACMTTARGDYYEEVSGRALDEAYEKYPNPKDYDFLDHFKKIPGSKNYEWVVPDKELSNTRYRWMSERTIELLNSKSMQIIPWNIEVDEEYQYGIGLHIRADLPYINVNDVEEFIELFNSRGLNAFDDKDKTPMCLTADELGVELKPGEKFVWWKDETFSHNTVAIKELS